MTLTLWKDNLLPVLTGAIAVDGNPFNLSSSTVKLQMRPEGSAVLKIDAAATVVNAGAGTVSYAWVTADTDTVGNFVGWWRVTTAGSFQDTPEFNLTITEHAPTSTAVPAPVAIDGTGNTTIYQGDSYLNTYGRALVYQLQVRDSPDLTGLTVKWRVQTIGLVKTMTVDGEDAVRVDLTSAETAALSTGVKQFEIEATVTAGEVVTLLRATLDVRADMI
jgi:hypothetical protein